MTGIKNFLTLILAVVIASSISMGSMAALNVQLKHLDTSVLGNVVNAGTLTATPNPPQLSNSIAILNQAITINTTLSGGVGPYTGNWAWVSPNALNSGSSLHITPSNLLSSNNLKITFTPTSNNTATVFFQGQTYTLTTATGTIFGTWTFIANATDASTNNTITTGSASLTIVPAQKVIPTLNSVSVTSSNLIVNSNQIETLEVKVTGGTSPFTYNYLVSNSVGVVYGAIYSSVSSSTNTFTFNVDPAWGSGSFNAAINVSDVSGNFVVNQTTFTVNSPTNNVVNALTSLNFNPAIPSIGQGQLETLSAKVFGGAGPYTYNYLVSNSEGVVASKISNTVSTSNSFSFTIDPSWGTGPFTAILSVTDSESNSVANSLGFTVNPTVSNSEAVALTIAHNGNLTNSSMYGADGFTVNAIVTGGTGPYAFDWKLNGASVAGNNLGNGLSSTSLGLPAAGNYVFNLTVTDQGNSNTFKLSNTLTINKNTTLFATDNGLGQYSEGNGIILSFNAIKTIDNQPVTWTLFVNGGEYSSTNSSVIIWNPLGGITLGDGRNNFSFTTAGNANYSSYSHNTIVYIGQSTTTSSTTTSTISNGGGGGGGGSTGGSGGGGGGAGSSKPVITNTTNGFTVNTLAQLGSFGNVFCGTITKVTDNYITPTSSGVTINGQNYVLTLNNPAVLVDRPQCDVELLNISYLPILQTVTLKFYTNSTALSNNPSASSSNTVAAVAVPGTLVNYTYKITPDYPAAIYLGPANTLVYISSITSTYAKLAAINVTNTIAAFPGYKPLLALNLNISSPSQISTALVMRYPCTIPSIAVESFELKNGSWVQLKNATVEASSCTIKFGIPKDPTVGIFESLAAANTSKAFTVPPQQPTSNATNSTKVKAPSTVSHIGPFTDTQLAALLIVLAVVAIFFYMLREA